jgi:hypothetical protein
VHEIGEMHADKRGIMTKTAVGLFEVSTIADEVVAHLLASGFSRDEVKLVRKLDYDGTPASETDILKIGGLPRERTGTYWKAVCRGQVLVAVTSNGDRADRAAEIMDRDGAIDVEERTAEAPKSGGALVDPSPDPGLYPRRPAAQLFEVS